MHTQEYKSLDGKENLFQTIDSLSRAPLDGAAYPFSRKYLHSELVFKRY